MSHEWRWPWIPEEESLVSRAGCQAILKAYNMSSEMTDFMSGIEYLHPLLGEQKQHIHGRVTWSETKLMIRNQVIGEEEGFNVGSDDGFYNFADDWEKGDWFVVAGICFCTFFMQGGNIC